MKTGKITVFYGDGRGKTSVAIGRSIRALGEGLRVVMIQFLDYRNNKEVELLKHFEPEFRIFRFQKEREFENVEAENKEVVAELQNAIHFANKIMDTGECELFILDGILEGIRMGYLKFETLVDLLKKRPENMEVVLTGDYMPEGLMDLADCVYQIQGEKQR